MGFADEVRQVNSKAPAPVVAAGAPTPELTPTDEMGGPIDGSEALPAETTPKPAVAATPAPVEPAVPAEPKKTRVRIGTKEFDNYEDAMEYAQELELVQAEADGYKKAVDELKPKDAAQAPKKVSDEIAELIFESPAQAIEKLEALMQDVADKTAERVRNEETRKVQLQSVWDDFYRTNPELQGSDDFVKHLLHNVHWKELGFIPSAQAMPKLAEIAKRALKIQREATLPAETLPAGRATVAPTSSTATPVVAEKVEPALDFVSQVNSIRRRVKQ